MTSRPPLWSLSHSYSPHTFVETSKMDILTIYAISVGSIFALLFVLRIKSCLHPWTGLYASFISRHFTYPYLLGRHQLAGPWTRAGAFFHLVYTALNVFLTFFHTTSVRDAGHRAGVISMINMIFLISTLHLSFLSDLLGITLRLCRRIHRAAGWAIAALLLFHVSAAFATRESNISLKQSKNLVTVIVSLSLFQWSDNNCCRVPRVLRVSFCFPAGSFDAFRMVFSYAAINCWQGLGFMGSGNISHLMLIWLGRVCILASGSWQ
jgi:hypothetical protein